MWHSQDRTQPRAWLCPDQPLTTEMIPCLLVNCTQTQPHVAVSFLPQPMTQELPSTWQLRVLPQTGLCAPKTD